MSSYSVDLPFRPMPQQDPTTTREPLVVGDTSSDLYNLQILFEKFLMHSKAFKGNTEQTIKWYKQTFQTFLKFALLKDVRQFNKDLLESWILYGRTHRKWSAKTTRSYMDAIGGFLEWCVKNEYLEENYIKQIERPKIPFKLPRHLTLEDAKLLLDWTKAINWHFPYERTRAVAVIATFLHTGMRKTELMNLKTFDVNMKEKTILVKAGKGEKDRVIPMTPELWGYLSVYLEDRKRAQKNTPYFFTSLREDDKLHDMSMKRMFEKIKEKSHMDVHPHLLRHTFAVLMLEGGADIYSVSKMMGHSRLQTTQIYLSATSVLLQEQIKKHPMNN